jgi:hypothetical protein
MKGISKLSGGRVKNLTGAEDADDADSNPRHPHNPRLIAKEVLADVSNDLPELERFFFDKLAPLVRSGAELVKLHQLSVRQNHSDPVVQIMEPFSDLRLIHRPLI